MSDETEKEKIAWRLRQNDPELAERLSRFKRELSREIEPSNYRTPEEIFQSRLAEERARWKATEADELRAALRLVEDAFHEGAAAGFDAPGGGGEITALAVQKAWETSLAQERCDEVRRRCGLLGSGGGQ